MNDTEKPLYDGPSRSQVKREALAITDLGKRLVELPAKKLALIPLEEHILAQIMAAKTMQRGALKRQYQYIGKLLRSHDCEPILAALKRFT